MHDATGRSIVWPTETLFSMHKHSIPNGEWEGVGGRGGGVTFMVMEIW